MSGLPIISAFPFGETPDQPAGRRVLLYRGESSLVPGVPWGPVPYQHNDCKCGQMWLCLQGLLEAGLGPPSCGGGSGGVRTSRDWPCQHLGVLKKPLESRGYKWA